MPYSAGSKSSLLGSTPSLACFSDSEMRRRSRSMSITLTKVSSPTFTTSSGSSTWRWASSEMCTRPSMPSSTRTNAPNGTSLVSYTHLRAHETRHDLVCRLLLEKKKQNKDNRKNYRKQIKKKKTTNHKT